jgi:hypothetical protein
VSSESNSSLGYLVTGPERSVIATLADVTIQQDIREVRVGYRGAVRAQYTSGLKQIAWCGKLIGVHTQDRNNLLSLPYSKLQLLLVAGGDTFKYKSILLENCYTVSCNKDCDDVYLRGVAMPDDAGNLMSYFDHVLPVVESDLLPPPSALVTNLNAVSGTVIHVPPYYWPDANSPGVPIPDDVLQKIRASKDAPKEKPRKPTIQYPVKREVDFDE